MSLEAPQVGGGRGIVTTGAQEGALSLDGAGGAPSKCSRKP